jgi:phosphatidylserine/phosphatidylglycerophosphate/cardiolipin synthase-like enzyme
MKRAMLFILILSVTAIRAFGQTNQGASRIAVYFSPGGGCTEAIVTQLDCAKREVLVQAYEFSSVPIAKALVAAQNRGVKVQVILDKSQSTEKCSALRIIRKSHIPIFIDDKYAIAHNKVMVIDQRWVITGSFNFTTAAETSNAENLLVIDDAAIAAKYAGNWTLHMVGSIRWGRGPAHPRN